MTHQIIRQCLLAAFLAAWMSSPDRVLAAPPAGRLLASQCAQCHGTDGGGPGFDQIAGKSARELYDELSEMKYRRVEGIMDRQARGYTDHQLRLIADYLSALPGGSGDD